MAATAASRMVAECEHEASSSMFGICFTFLVKPKGSMYPYSRYLGLKVPI